MTPSELEHQAREIARLTKERDALYVAARALLDALDRADAQFPEAADLDALLPPWMPPARGSK